MHAALFACSSQIDLTVVISRFAELDALYPRQCIEDAGGHTFDDHRLAAAAAPVNVMAVMVDSLQMVETAHSLHP